MGAERPAPTAGIWQQLAGAAVRSLPEPTRAWLRGLRGSYVRLLRGFGSDDVKRGLERVGVVRGDTLIVHSSWDSFEGFRGTPALVIRTLQDAVGPAGTILMPTLPFGGSVAEYAATDPVFDVRRSVARTGLLPEVFRRSPQVVRSLHPTHSVAAWGTHAPALIADHELAGTPCGRATPYGRLLDCDGKILFLGVPVDAMTFFHAIEEALEAELPVPLFQPAEYALRYRDQHGVTRVAKTRLFSQRLAGRRDLVPLVNELRSRGAWREARVARMRLVLFAARDALAAAADLTGKGVFCYRL